MFLWPSSDIHLWRIERKLIVISKVSRKPFSGVIEIFCAGGYRDQRYHENIQGPARENQDSRIDFNLVVYCLTGVIGLHPREECKLDLGVIRAYRLIVCLSTITGRRRVRKTRWPLQKPFHFLRTALLTVSLRSGERLTDMAYRELFRSRWVVSDHGHKNSMPVQGIEMIERQSAKMKRRISGQ